MLRTAHIRDRTEKTRKLMLEFLDYPRPAIVETMVVYATGFHSRPWQGVLGVDCRRRESARLWRGCTSSDSVPESTCTFQVSMLAPV